MPAKAFVLIETEVGRTKDVVTALHGQKVKEIKSVDLVTGPYDVIAVVEHDDFNAVGALVTEKIHPIPGIKRTVTCLSIRVS
ncbi:MAG: Lrp/AsnC family transcriptional regulator [Chloroflexi bacterium]|nr:Lrp/AsnC family transcriptional regulator [Chloroflexota bacterium]